MPDINKTEFTPTQVVAVVLSTTGVLLDATVIDGHTAKLITGLASIIVPAVWIMANAIIHHANKKAASVVEAARLMTGPAKFDIKP